MKIKPLALAAIIILLGIIFVFTRRNTSVLNQPTTADIKQNNTTTVQQERNDMLDLALVPQEILVNGETHTLNLPEGFSISVFADGLESPRSFTFDDGGNMYVSDKGTGKIILIRQNSSQKEIDNGLRSIHGIEWHENSLYIAEEDKVSVYENIDSDGNYEIKKVLVSGLPTGGHSTRTIRISPDKKIFLSTGSSCNLCEEKDKRRAAITTYNLDGSNEETFATGLRNSVGIVFYKGQLWGVDNGRDLLGDDLPVEEVNIIQNGKHYGWPYCHGNLLVNPEYKDKETFCKTQTQAPTFEMQAHSAPLGLAFTPDGFLKNNLVVPFHGSWNRTVPTGYKVIRFDMSVSNPQPINFITGWLDTNGKVWGRPVDVIFDKNNNLYITDDSAGVIYKVSRND